MSIAAQPEMNGFESQTIASSKASHRFFPGGQRGALLEQIVHLARFGSLTVNVSGETGTGKSHLLHAVKCSLPGNAIEVKASLLMSSSELLNQMLHQLMANRFHHDLPDLPSTNDEEALLSLIGSYLLRLSDAGNTVVFLIDDAHEISEEALLVLFQLMTDKKYKDAVQCILFSEPYIEKHLAKPAVKAVGGEQVFTLRIPSMDLAALSEYLIFLESVKPESERILYSNTDIHTIHELSEGKLGQVNAAIRSLIEKDSSSSSKNNSFSLPKYQYLVLALVILTLGGIAFMYQSEKSKETQGDVVRSESLSVDKLADISRKSVVQPTEEKEENAELVGGEGVAENSQVNRPVSSNLLEQLRKKQEELLEGRKSKLSVTTENQQAVKVGGSEKISESSKDIAKKPVAAIVSEDLSSLEEVVVNQKKDKDPLQLADSVSSASNKWIKSQPGNHYTIQILGAHSKQNVSRYVDGFRGDKTQLHVYEGILRDQPWFVLIYGSFDDRASAKKVGTESLGLKDLWIRNFSAIQNEMVR